MQKIKGNLGVINRYREYLPVTKKTPIVSLSEGSTPLIYARELSELVQAEVYLKYEGLNPTCSFKDRGMTVAISKAAEQEAKAVLCASTGNTSASAAAYAARAGMQCVVILPVGRIAGGKMVQAYLYGARVVAIEGNFDDALRIVRELGERGHFVVVNSTNPYRLEGQKTAAFEIIEELGKAPDLHILPVGNAGNITAYWKGYREFYDLGRSNNLPVMLGVQASGAAPLYHGAPMDQPETLATAIRIGQPASWDGAMDAIKESLGEFDMVTDAEILAAQKWLASKEGVFAEPASVVPVALLLKIFQSKDYDHCRSKTIFSKLPANPTLVLTITGHGLKDPETASHALSEPFQAKATLKAVLKAIEVS